MMRRCWLRQVKVARVRIGFSGPEDSSTTPAHAHLTVVLPYTRPPLISSLVDNLLIWFHLVVIIWGRDMETGQRWSETRGGMSPHANCEMCHPYRPDKYFPNARGYHSNVEFCFNSCEDVLSGKVVQSISHDICDSWILFWTGRRQIPRPRSRETVTHLGVETEPPRPGTRSVSTRHTIAAQRPPIRPANHFHPVFLSGSQSLPNSVPNNRSKLYPQNTFLPNLGSLSTWQVQLATHLKYPPCAPPGK